MEDIINMLITKRDDQLKTVNSPGATEFIKSSSKKKVKEFEKAIKVLRAMNLKIFDSLEIGGETIILHLNPTITLAGHIAGYPVYRVTRELDISDNLESDPLNRRIR